MATTVADAEPLDEADVVPEQPQQAVTGLDLLALGAALLTVVVAWSSLALAHLGHHSLPGVLALSAVAVAVVVLVVRRWARPRVVSDAAGLAVGLGCVAVSLGLTLFGFSYGVADKDPGIYVSHAVWIAQTGDYRIHDELVAQQAKDPAFPVRLVSPGARFPGIWVHDVRTGTDVPQFYHLWPALLATAFDLGGYHGLTAVPPLVGALSVLLVCALLRRIGRLVAGDRGGLVVAAAGGLLLATNMMQVWQARYPTTEILSQALFLATLVGLVVAIQSRSTAAAGLAGVAVGVSWLNRADGVLLVLSAVALGGMLVLLARVDRRAFWFAGGLAVVVPHAAWQAYHAAGRYTGVNGVPTLHRLVVMVVGGLAGAVVMRVLLANTIDRLQKLMLARRAQLVIGALVVLGALGLIALGFLRPRLFGADLTDYNGQIIRSYDEQAMRRLSWFLTLPAFAVLPVGLALVALRRWRAELWVVTVPTLLLMPLYVYTPKNSPQLMWWTRRYVPTVLPGVVLLLALALAGAWVWRLRGRAVLRVPALLVTAGFVAVYLHQSLPVRRHDEFKGSFELSAEIAAVAHGQRGIFLWEPDTGCCSGATHLFPTSVWLQQRQDSVLLLPDDPAHGLSPMAMVAAYRRAFPGRPLFVVTGQGRLPAGVDPAAVQQVARVGARLPVWDESVTARPSKAHQVVVDVLVWQVRGTGQRGA